MSFAIKTIVTNFTLLNLDFGDYTYASVNISGNYPLLLFKAIIIGEFFHFMKKATTRAAILNLVDLLHT